MAHDDFRAALAEPVLTERLILRAPRPGDAADIARLGNNYNIHKQLARLPYPCTLAEAEQLIAESRTQTDHNFAILNRDEDFLGLIGLRFEETGAPEIHFWLGEPYWGEGIATEAVQALVLAVKNAGGISLVAQVQTGNIASLRTLEKAGFFVEDDYIGACGPHKGIAITRLRWERIE